MEKHYWSNSGGGRLALAVAMLFGGVMFTRQPADTDLWGHVRFGQDKLALGIDHATTYSFTTTDHLWINHEYLSEILMALSVAAGGAVGLIVAKCALGLGVLVLIALSGRMRNVHPISVSVAITFVSANLLTSWMARPKLLTFSCFAAMVTLLLSCFRRWDISHGIESSDPTWESRLYHLWALPFLFCFWANAHGGFVAGLAILAAYFFLRFVQASLLIKRIAWRFGGFLLLIWAASFAATVLNPYGWNLHRWLLGALGASRPEVTEWQRLSVGMPSTWNVMILVAVAILCTWKSGRKSDYVHLVISAIVAWQAFLHQRHVPFLVILIGFWWLPHIDGFLRPTSFVDRITKRSHGVVAMVLIAACCFQVASLVPQLRGIKVPLDRYPVSALRFMVQQSLDGKVFVSFDWGQYAIGVLGTRSLGEPGKIQVAYDGRFRTCYDQELIDLGFDFELGNQVERNRSQSSRPFNETQATEIGSPNLILIHREYGNAGRVMQKLADKGTWDLLYQDDLAQLFGRANLYSVPESKHYLPPASRDISTKLQEGFAWWPADPNVP